MRHCSSPHLHSRPWPTDILPDMLLAVLVCSSECRVGERISLQQNARDCAIHRVDNLFFVYPFMKSYHRFPSHHGSAISRACATMIDIPSCRGLWRDAQDRWRWVFGTRHKYNHLSFRLCGCLDSVQAPVCLIIDLRAFFALVSVSEKMCFMRYLILLKPYSEFRFCHKYYGDSEEMSC